MTTRIKIYRSFSDIPDIDRITSLIRAQLASYGAQKEENAIQAALQNALKSDSRSVLFALEKQDTEIGFAFCNICSGLESGGDYLWMNEIYIHKEHRKQGHGKELLSFIEKWSKEQNLKSLLCVTGTENLNAREFYKSSGYDISQAIWVSKSLFISSRRNR